MSFQQILGQRLPGFVFGGNTGETYERLQAKRRAAQQLAANASRFPQSAGEGLTALGQAIAYRSLMGDVRDGEKAGKDEFKSAFRDLMSARSGGRPAPQTAPASQANPALPTNPLPQNRPAQPQPATDGTDAFNASLARTESGGDYSAANSEGYVGKYQFGDARLADASAALGMQIDKASFRNDPDLQERVQSWHVNDIDKFITDNGLDRFEGREVGGVSLSRDSLRAMAHLGGKNGMKRFLETGGKYNPSDSNGTSLLDYARTHAGAGAGVRAVSAEAAPSASPIAGGQPNTPAAPAMGDGIDPRLVELLDNPYASPGQQAIMRLMLERQLGASAPPDPMQALKMQQAQLGVERSQLEIDQMRNPAAPKPTNDMREYEFAQQQGFEGSFTDFILAQRKAGGSTVTVNNGPDAPAVPEYNKLPAGWVYKRGENGQVIIDADGAPTAIPITGGPASLDADKRTAAAEAKQAATERNGNVVLEDIDRALAGLDEGTLPTTGPIGGYLSGIPGTQAFDVAQLIQTVRANSGFDRLQAMRDSSPTGGALGAINKTEMDLLQTALGNLSQSQSGEQLRHNLRRVRSIYGEIIHGSQNDDASEGAALPDGVAEEDIRHTMQVHNMTREQVLEALRNGP